MYRSTQAWLLQVAPVGISQIKGDSSGGGSKDDIGLSELLQGTQDLCLQSKLWLEGEHQGKGIHPDFLVPPPSQAKNKVWFVSRHLDPNILH